MKTTVTALLVAASIAVVGLAGTQQISYVSYDPYPHWVDYLEIDGSQPCYLRHGFFVGETRLTDAGLSPREYARDYLSFDLWIDGVWVRPASVVAFRDAEKSRQVGEACWAVLYTYRFRPGTFAAGQEFELLAVWESTYPGDLQYRPKTMTLLAL
jgi:hypothetical protein